MSAGHSGQGPVPRAQAPGRAPRRALGLALGLAPGRALALAVGLAVGLSLGLGPVLPAARAADATPQSGEAMLTERDFLVEIPRVISASRLPQAPADSPGAVTVIDREMIRASGARTVAELFRLVPGFVVGFPGGSRPVVAYHGLSGQFSQRMQVLLDGRSLYAPYLLGGVDWSTLPVELDEIERIEVLRGSNSASYGANAFLGVANIVTRTAAQSRGGHFSVAAGGRGVADASARYGAGGGAFNWRLSAGTRGDDGLAGAHDSWRSDYASLRAEWQLTGIDELSLIAGVADNRSGIGSKRLAADPPRDERTRSSHLLLRWRRAFAADHEMSLTVSSTVDEGDDRFSIPATPTDALVIDYGRFARRDHFEYQHYLSLSDTLRTSWGAEYRSDRVTARQLFNRPEAQRSESTRAYLNAEWTGLPHWTVNAGGLVERDTLSGTHLAPRLVANWKLGGGQTLRFGYSDAFRTPSLFEQRSDWRFVFQGQTIDIRFLSRGGLEPERVRTFELSWLGEFRALDLEVDLRAFRERITGLITQQLYALPPGQEFDPNSGAFDLRNADRAKVTGVDYQLRWRPSARQLWVLGHSLIDRSGSEPFVTASIPPYTLHLLGALRLDGGRSVSMLYTLRGPVRWIGEPAGVGVQQRLDLRFEQSFSLAGARGSLALVGQNLLGAQDDFRPGQRLEPTGWLVLSLDY